MCVRSTFDFAPKRPEMLNCKWLSAYANRVSGKEMMTKILTLTRAPHGAWIHLNEAEVAEWLNLSKRTLQGWRLKGEGPKFEKFGRSVRYAPSSVEAWILERERSSTSASSPPQACTTHGSDLIAEFGVGERP